MSVTKKIDEKPATAAQSHSTDEKRQRVGLLLRNADKFIKEAHLQEARSELQKVRDIDPNNAYALAFEERIAAIQKEQAKPPEQPPAVEAPPKPVEKKTQPPPSIAVPEKPQQAEQPTAKQVAKVEAPAQTVVDEKKLSEEREKLEEQFRKEQAVIREELEKTFQLRLEDETKKVEGRYGEQLKTEKERIEKEAKMQVEAQYAPRLQELQASMEGVRRAFAEKEQQSIALARKQMEAEFAGQLASEVTQLRQSTTVEEKEFRTKLEEALRSQMQKETESRLAKERAAIEEQYKKREKELEQSFKDRQDLILNEHERSSEQKIQKAKEQEAEKLVQQRVDLQKKLDLEYHSKLQAAIAEEQKKFDKQLKKALEEERAILEKERQRLQEEQARLDQMRQSVQAEAEKNISGRVEQTKQELTEVYQRRMELFGIRIPKTREEKLKLYHDRIREAWATGPLTMEKAQGLMELQGLLGISFEDHAECESNVRLQLYANAVEQGILSDKIQATDAKALDELKHRYDITVEEAANLEPLILSAFQRSATKATILLSDDDVDLTNLISDRLKEQGYKVIVYNSVSAALEFLQNNPVDLILSDLRYQGEKMDGFTYFKEVQKIPKCRKVPFVLMTAMDEVLFMRTGVQLGIDDYLTKPLDLELLVAVVEGKLKKYQSLRES